MSSLGVGTTTNISVVLVTPLEVSEWALSCDNIAAYPNDDDDDDDDDGDCK